ncbi:MAG: toll/interleukin-1 receptor domain-containing protein, partial [Blastocatellia bacterium]
MPEPANPVRVFCSYAHEDRAPLEELRKHLRHTQRLFQLEIWDDHNISGGQEWEAEIREKLHAADIILLLVSSDFMASDFIHDVELKTALERHEKHEAIVIPVILRHCDWEKAAFEKLQALPAGAKPITAWDDVDEAMTSIATGIRALLEKLPRQDQPAPPATPDLGELERYLALRKIDYPDMVNPYLLGREFVGRQRELSELTQWLRDEQDAGALCICDLGGSGKTALVSHWLQSAPARAALRQLGVRQFWCTFYARNYDWRAFLRDLAAAVTGAPLTGSFTGEALCGLILRELRRNRWLLILDGLEREMAAYCDAGNYLIDSEQQDIRNEQGRRNENTGMRVLPEEKYLRSDVFSAFLRELPQTQTRVLITTRLFPEQLRAGAGQVREYPFAPMSHEDATLVWRLAGREDPSPLTGKFFASVAYHPQVISVVSAAVHEYGQGFVEWLHQDQFTDQEREQCWQAPYLTARRHRWLELATRDMTRDAKLRPAWLALCHIIFRSEACDIDALTAQLVDREPGGVAATGRFKSGQQLLDKLEVLEKRRLIGMDDELKSVDVHPVIRGHVTSYITRQYQPGQQGIDREMVEYLESSDDTRELLLRVLGQSDLDERLAQTARLLEQTEMGQRENRETLNLLRRFYP